MTSPSLPIPVKDGLRSRPNRVPKPSNGMAFQRLALLTSERSGHFHVPRARSEKSSYIDFPSQGACPSLVAQRGQP